MTTLDTLSTADPAVDEVANAALAMADFDAKGGDYATAYWNRARARCHDVEAATSGRNGELR